MLRNLKANISQIHWPSRKSLIKRTSICVVTAAVLAVLIAGWTTVIEYGVNWVLSLL